MSACTVTLIACPNREEAERLAESLVTEKLAACVNIVPGVTSVYFWEGKLCKEDEHLLIVKSVVEASSRIAARVRELHSYSVPEVVTISIVSGNPEYLGWVENWVR